MCKPQCVLVLVALYTELVHPWEIAVGVEDQLIFYTDGTQTHNETLLSRNITALAYDEVNDMMLYVDKQSNNNTICGFNLHSKENKCFIERNGSDIQAIVLDPVTQTLFFTDTNDSTINWISLKPGSVHNVHGNLLIKIDDRAPRDIAVDSCKGYIYWITTSNEWSCKDCMERARFNGSQRESIDRKYKWLDLLSLAIDPPTRKVYYFDGFDLGTSYENGYLNRADFNWHREEILHRCEGGGFSATKELSVSKDHIYWVNSSDSYNTVWQIAKNAIGYNNKQPEKLSTFSIEKTLALATNYKIEDQMRGLLNCEDLSSLIPAMTVINSFLNIKQTAKTVPMAKNLYSVFV